MSSKPATNQIGDISPGRREPDRTPLTPEQVAFAKVIGQRLAERWAKRHESQPLVKAAVNQLP